MDRPFSLLLVEDEATLRGLVAQFLRREGFQVAEAEDGLVALLLFEEVGPFDAVITDLMMPGMDGLELCERLRSATADLPIVVCSAAFSSDPERRLHDLGIDGFLRKPYHPQALLDRIRLELHGADAATGLPAARKVG